MSTKIGELRGVPEVELRKRIEDRRKELAELRLKAGHGAVEKPSRLRELRREIARALTILREPRPEQTGGTP